MKISNPAGSPKLPYANMNGPVLEGRRIQKGKVLIVDDEIDIVRTLQEYLTEKGYKALGCTSGKGAIDALKRFDFDIFLIDLVLPETDGIDVLKSAFEIDPYLIGIIITGKGTVQSAVDAMKAGAFDYLVKPFEFELLSPILDRAMKVRRLIKSEARGRILAEELTYEVRKLQKIDDNTAEELQILELREEIEALKAELKTYKVMERNLYLNDNGIGD